MRPSRPAPCALAFLAALAIAPLPSAAQTAAAQAAASRTAASETAAAQTAPQATYGPELQGFEYPFPVERFALPSQGQELAMAYMDVAPERPNGRTVVLLHGKNFCAATWEGTIRALLAAGYRVIAPDQIGFCRSSKPQRYQFSFHQLAANTNALLKARGIERATVVGHSMGGMLAARYALAYPGAVERLVLVNPLGLEDWGAKGVPYASIDETYRTELRTSFESIKAYQQKFYYAGGWKPDYDRWAGMLAGMYAGPGREAVAWSQALTSDLIYTQPVVHEFGRIRTPTLLLIGMKDRTAPGANRAPPEITAGLGDYPVLARAAAQAIPGARLTAFPDLGHAPQIEAPDVFHGALLEGIGRGG
ncbi:alpha/beta fold hydrolase [Arenibaculum pallidiluteum]|uniref:alpha/beta fold hydrolase n=1 Tax=Arenibaculum pallidiluteum TaxID=2812559 RepID=UPI001A979574|nr:alpha/beta hydrolase [Arenibaculum pallidiluteum]